LFYCRPSSVVMCILRPSEGMLLSILIGMGCAGAVTPFAEGILGVWMPKTGVPTKSILGPVAYEFLASGPGRMHSGLTACRDERTGDVWFTLLNGQLWRTSGDQTQYCFGQQTLFEQSPFSVQQVTDTSVNRCWRNGDRGMPTHKKGCQGCDCARIFLNLTDPDTLTLTFWMSPPVVHADFTFTRSGAAPSFKAAVESTMAFPYQQCQMRDHYGPNIPLEPDLRNRTRASRGGCAFASRQVAHALMKHDDRTFDLGDILHESEVSSQAQAGQCR